MTDRLDKFGLQVAAELVTFVEQEALPGTGVDVDVFWKGLSDLVHDLGPKNRALLQKRADIQAQLDEWYRENKGTNWDQATYQAFLKEIGYLVPEGDAFDIETANVDPEIASIAGPQLVVPITNARFALNAANARWGSLYDALYGTDALGDLPTGGGYDAERGSRVIAWGRDFLNEATPLATGSWTDVTEITVKNGALETNLGPLAEATKFAGHQNDGDRLSNVFLRNNGLLINIVIDPTTPVGQTDAAGVSDIIFESALSTIMDCEDSVAAVDAEDKALAYRNWLGLMRGDLSETVTKGGKTFDRVLNEDVTYTAPNGETVTHKGRSLMLVRNVGHLMSNPAILDKDGLEIGEGLMDAMITTMIAMHDLKRESGNSVHGSVYIVKPKMHGPEEGAFAVDILDRG